MEPFIGPKFSLPLNWLGDLIYPVVIKALQNIDEIIVSENDKALLRSLKKERLLFFSNHPTTAEPPITYYIGNLMGTRFKYMASRQVFDWQMGINGWLISHAGAFSVIAGIADRESLKTARNILSAPEGKLVLYPEGEPTSGENDSLMPFQYGIAQIAFWALEDARKQDPIADITILPAFMKYTIRATEKEIMEDLDDSMKKIEKKYGINPGNKNILRRFLTAGRFMLEEAEAEYSITDVRDHDFDYRVGRVRHAILDNIATKLNITNYDKEQDAIHKLRQLFAVMELISIGYPDPKLPKMNHKELDWMKTECVKAFDFIVIKKDYLVSYPSAERFYEWLARYESYIFGAKPRALGGEPTHLPRTAYVRLSKPFGLSKYYDDYKKKKKETVEQMLTDLRSDMQKMLDEAMKLTKPLVTPYDIGE